MATLLTTTRWRRSYNHTNTTSLFFQLQYIPLFTMRFTRSQGQGFQSSRTTRTLTATNRFSIIQRLAARALTGDNLHIQTHQHFGYRIHLVWSRPSIQITLDEQMDRNTRIRIINELESLAVQSDDRCLERIIPNGSRSFCQQLMWRGAQNLCFCACRYCWIPISIINSKTTQCYRGPTKHRLHDFCYVRECQSYEYKCQCNITSSETLVRW